MSADRIGSWLDAHRPESSLVRFLVRWAFASLLVAAFFAALGGALFLLAFLLDALAEGEWWADGVVAIVVCGGMGLWLAIVGGDE